jgi:putative selenate reductase
VCPNDANFVYEIPPADLEYSNYRWNGGRLEEVSGGRFTVEREHQIANYADFCNDCGNCDVFCPEDGGPYIEKPRFFSSLDSWRRDRAVGFHVRPGTRDSIWGRFGDGTEHLLQLDRQRGAAVFKTHGVEIDVDLGSHRALGVRGTAEAGPEPVEIDMRVYHILRTLLGGVLDERRTNYINASRA